MVQPENYFVLDPREATVMDLMRLLLYSDLENRKFVDTSVENLENRLCEFGGRWIIFVSIVVQKLLIILRKPLSFLGFALGFWLNLPSSNGGFFKIFLNLVRGLIFLTFLFRTYWYKLGLTLHYKLKYNVEYILNFFIAISRTEARVKIDK